MGKKTFPPCSVCGAESTQNFENMDTGRRTYFCAGHGQALLKMAKAAGATVTTYTPPSHRQRSTLAATAAPVQTARRGGGLSTIMTAVAITAVIIIAYLLIFGGIR